MPNAHIGDIVNVHSAALDGGIKLTDAVRELSFCPTLQDILKVVKSLDGHSGVEEDELSAYLLRSGGWRTAESVHENP